MTKEQETLVLDNLRLVDHVLHHGFYIPPWAEYDDLQQEGRIGLIKAAQYFNPSKGNQFSTYAVPMIWGYMKKYVRQSPGSGMRLPRSAHDFRSAVASHIHQFGYISEDEYGYIAESIGIPLDLIPIILCCDNPVRLEDLVSDTEGGLELGDSLGYNDPGYEEFESTSDIDLATSRVIRDIKGLYKDIYEEWLYSRMFGEGEVNTVRLANKYGFSRGYISRIISRITKKMAQVLYI